MILTQRQQQRGGQAGVLWRALLLAAALIIPARAAHGASSARLNLRSIHFVSSSTGWGMSDTALLRTGDGGATWQAVTPKGLTLTSTFLPAATFLNDHDAWIADGFQVAKPGVFRTTDGGRTWSHATLPLPVRSGGPIGISQIDFIDARHGWALEDLGGGAGTFYFALLGTTDGGAHWSSLAGGTLDNPPAPGAFPHNVQGIHFDSAASGWTSVVIFAGPQLSGLFHSTDGGHVWRKVSLPMTGAFKGGFFGVQPPVFFDARQGAMIVSTETALGIYTTGDGGTTWTATTPLMVTLSLAGARPFAADIVDAQHVWVVAGAHLFFSADLGRHWSMIRQSLGFGGIATVDYIDVHTGWALGGSQDNAGASHSALRRTTDGGHTWTVLQPMKVA